MNEKETYKKIVGKGEERRKAPKFILEKRKN